MRLLLSSLLLLIAGSQLYAQQSYFPPTTGTQWDSISPQSIGWCQDEVDSLLAFLDSSNTKGVMILKNGKIVVEEYFDTFNKDSLWYYASITKSMVAFLIGIAQQNGDLNINDKTSNYLGQGWTSAPSAKEDLITLKNQLSMTTGLDYNVPDTECLDDTCLNYLSDAGTEWYYYNAPYRLLQVVIDSATGRNINQYTFQELSTTIGMGGFFLNYIRFGTLRDLARFGLLIQNRGIWNQDTILSDSAYFNEMISTSQTLNRGYGYLWWLNGTGSHMAPGSSFVFQKDIIPNAPADLFAGLGLNDQKLYIVPSEKLVIVRLGDSASSGIPLALSSFDNALWEMLNKLPCPTSTISPIPNGETIIYPNPASNHIRLVSKEKGEVRLELIYPDGRQAFKTTFREEILINVASLPNGLYLAKLTNSSGKGSVQRIFVSH